MLYASDFSHNFSRAVTLVNELCCVQSYVVSSYLTIEDLIEDCQLLSLSYPLLGADILTLEMSFFGNIDTML